MKPTVDSILAKYNIRPYNGSWYVQEKKLRELLEQIVAEVYEAGQESVAKHNDPDYYEPATRHFREDSK